MDLKTIKGRLDYRRYGSFGSIARDVNTIVESAFTFGEYIRQEMGANHYETVMDLAIKLKDKHHTALAEYLCSRTIDDAESHIGSLKSATSIRKKRPTRQSAGPLNYKRVRIDGLYQPGHTRSTANAPNFISLSSATNNTPESVDSAYQEAIYETRKKEDSIAVQSEVNVDEVVGNEGRQDAKREDVDDH